MRVIHKYVVEVGRFVLDLQEGAEVLTVQMQGDKAVMWVRVEAHNPKSARRFALVGTGHDLREAAQWDYKGTIQDGPLVWHLLAE